MHTLPLTLPFAASTHHPPPHLTRPFAPLDVFLALGEILSVLTRGIFSVLVGICDVLAAASCCWRVPYDQRPDRGTFVYSNAITKDVGGGKVLGKVVKSQEERARRREELLKKGEGEKLGGEESKLGDEEGATPGAAAVEHGEKAVEAEGDKPVKPTKEPFAARFFGGGNKASSKKVDGSPAAAATAAGATDTDATTTAEAGAPPAATVPNVDEQPSATAATSPAKSKRSFWSGKSSTATKPAHVEKAQSADAAVEPTTENATEAPTVDASTAAASGTAAPASSRIQEPRGRWFFGGGKTNVNGTTPASKAEEAAPAEVDGTAEATPEVAAAETPAATETPVSKAPSKKGFAAWKSKKSTADKPTAPAPPRRKRRGRRPHYDRRRGQARRPLYHGCHRGRRQRQAQEGRRPQARKDDTSYPLAR